MDAYGRGAVTDDAPRCWRCGRLLAEIVTRPWVIRCTRCKAANRGGDGPLTQAPQGISGPSEDSSV